MEHQDKFDLDTVVTRADALMQRRRPSPLAASHEAPGQEPPILTEVVPADMDAPLLVSDEPPAPTPPKDGTAAAADFESAVMDILAHDFAQRLQQRLTESIPALVESALEAALAGITEELRQGLAASADAALEDILSQKTPLAVTRQRR